MKGLVEKGVSASVALKSKLLYLALLWYQDWLMCKKH